MSDTSLSLMEQAGRLLVEANDEGVMVGSPYHASILAEAQVYATLAVAAATREQRFNRAGSAKGWGPM